MKATIIIEGKNIKIELEPVHKFEKDLLDSIRYSYDFDVKVNSGEYTYDKKIIINAYPESNEKA